MASSFPALIAESLKTEKFRLLDIGCSGGLDPLWRAFEPRLQALGIDASVTECKRLAGLERNPDVSYVAAFAARSADKPIDISAGPAAPAPASWICSSLQRVTYAVEQPPQVAHDVPAVAARAGVYVGLHFR